MAALAVVGIGDAWLGGVPITERRLAALAALLLAVATLVLAVVVAVAAFPRGLVLLGCVGVAFVFAWY
ncbi:MAG: hypothetical protein ACM3UV_03940, partial [Nocardioidaceae bacterium]